MRIGAILMLVVAIGSAAGAQTSPSQSSSAQSLQANRPPASQSQISRNAYRNAYRSWKQTDPNLEHDAVAGGTSIASRATVVAAGATSFAEARKEFLTAWGEELTQKALGLEDATAVGGVESAKALAKTGPEVVAAQTARVGRMIDTFAGDSDPAIQQVRLALERERAALALLKDAVGQRQNAVSSGVAAAESLESVRTKAAQSYRKIAAAVQESAALAEQQSSALGAYYKKLSDAAATGSMLSGLPAGQVNSGQRTGDRAQATGDSGQRGREAELARTPAITPVPMVRYVGAWVFPTGGAYVGTQPEFMDLVVHDENGHCTGTLFARFKLPAGSGGDPVLRFDFTGEFASTRRQTFTLVTSDGANGTIELIPGSAFNLLEVNFQTDPKPGKVRQANVVLVKR